VTKVYGDIAKALNCLAAAEKDISIKTPNMEMLGYKTFIE
jgi:hypothetical protein